ncbi:hypothetical protein [Streptomyces sp. NPDC051567]|uniref:hypothetical protein n=1 Tax=Streptomyces sp. NPDC051567 TaxID=3365660 RepID=UPI0037A5A027
MGMRGQGIPPGDREWDRAGTISEPELDGAWDVDDRARTAEADDPAGPDEPPAPYGVGYGDGPGRPWRWALVAVVATSAVWAGGLFAYGDRLTAPEIRYRASDNLCEQAEMTALGAALGDLDGAAEPHADRHPAVDWSMCSRAMGTDGTPHGYFVWADVELHKKTDPAAEFEVADSGYQRYPGGADRWERVPGLGEEALVNTPGTGDLLHLRVRDGGAVLSFRMGYTNLRGPEDEAGQDGTGGAGGEPVLPPQPEREELKAAMVEDMRAMMARLRK